MRQIVVPLEFTDKSDLALDAARRLARLDSETRTSPEKGSIADPGEEPAEQVSTIQLLHVIETLSDSEDSELKEFYEQLTHRARAELEKRAAQLIEEGLQAVTAVRYGNRVRAIVTFAHEIGADVIVLGSHVVDPADPGAGLASISYQVAALAPCSIVLLKHREPA